MTGGEGLFDADAAATPLTPDERNGLIPAYIALRHELNAAEQANILKAQAVLFGRRARHGIDRLLADDYPAKLHRQMFGDVWRWAGQYRRSERNLGVGWPTIPVEMRDLTADARAWRASAAFTPDEFAVRFHHRLVWIHPFANGNGRTARMMADLLAAASGQPRFSWGGANIADPGDIRARYVAALRAADRHDLAPLLAFARS